MSEIITDLQEVIPITLKIQVSNNRVIGCKYDRTEVEDGWILCNDFPANFFDDVRHWLYINGEFVKESQEDIERREEQERFYAEANDTSLSHRIDLFVASIPVLPMPPKRNGYIWKQMYNADGNVFGWEEVVDPYYRPEHKGTYTDPIPYEVGDTVTMYTNPDPFEGDGWYTYDGDVKVCIKSGVPTGFDDEEYFAYFVEE